MTTIDGTLEMHIYDMTRIEVLEGPQGTLYGASSQAGTIRIITNKPDPTKFEAGYDARAATRWITAALAMKLRASSICRSRRSRRVRLVGWEVHDAGYIDNVAGTNANAGIINGVRTFPTWSADGNDSGDPQQRRDRAGLDQQCRLRQERLQHREHARRPRRPQTRYRRQLDDHADHHGSDSDDRGILRL